MCIAFFKNAYAPPQPAKTPRDVYQYTTREEYDFNYCLLTQPIRVLEGSGRDVRLVPLVPSEYAQALLDAVVDRPEVFRYMPIKPWKTLGDVLVWLEEAVRSDPTRLLYAIVDKRTGLLAGMVAYMNSSAVDLVTELSFVLILPHAQRSHVLTHTVSLMLDHSFDLPSEGGHGLRRVQWQAHASNLPSVKAALRLGFIQETPERIRLQRALLPDKEGTLPGRPGDGQYERGIASRDSYILAITYPAWLDGGVKGTMDRLVNRKPSGSGPNGEL
ncbi:GNAT domain [Phaffia rhodozyma]|uniref:GNAT domain n=1 Tax=Phaffia rhodozyma TaxID=264483 RepID=A0A0F7SPZ7_PHARH|nr:GNAT family acetyltransferase [Phaffia rhodozyma]CED82759.1 GNAT domain [Phaffia rhodozyma]